MEGKTLVSVVSDILQKPVTENQAKKFALNNYGILATHIRNQFIAELRPPEPKTLFIVTLKSNRI